MATKQYTFADVKKHIDQQSTWIVVHNNVYDVTEFLNEHPGGEEVLLEQAGRDASEAFEDVGHSTDARGLMAKYKIGEIVEHERKPVNEKSNINWNSSQDDSQKRNLEQILPDFISRDNFDASSLTQWLVPIALGVIATIIYRFYFQSH